MNCREEKNLKQFNGCVQKNYFIQNEKSLLFFIDLLGSLKKHNSNDLDLVIKICFKKSVLNLSQI